MRGVHTAIVTPFKNGLIDFSAFERLISRQIEAGIHGIVVCGTTGESPALSIDEKRALFKKARILIPENTLFIAGTGTNSTEKTLQLCRIAEDEGADALLVVTPYYNRPPQSALVDHYVYVADRVRIPVILYNVPTRTGVDLSLESISILSQHPNIKGIKEASSDMKKIARIKKETSSSDFIILSGDDNTFLPFLSLGGDGIISVYTNLNPDRFLMIFDAINSSDLNRARNLFLQTLPVLFALSISTNPIPIKEALSIYGYIEREFRLPLKPLNDNDLELLKNALIKNEGPVK